MTEIGLSGLSVWLVALGFFAFGCAAQPTMMRPPMPFSSTFGPLVIAHRGGSLEAPENTLASMQHAKSVGADWLEFDVYLSKDGELVVFHDETLERLTDAQGPVEEMTFKQLRALSVGHPKWTEDQRMMLQGFGVTPPDFGDRYANEKMPTLNEILAISDVKLMIELKKTVRVQEVVAKVVAAIHAAHAEDRVVVGSFELDLMQALNAADPTLPLIGIAEETEFIDAMLKMPISVLGVRTDKVAEAVQKAPRGVAVWAWTAYSPAMADAIVQAGAHGIITDVPQQILQVMRAVPSTHIPLTN